MAVSLSSTASAQNVTLCGKEVSIAALPKLILVGETHGTPATMSYWNQIINRISENKDAYIFQEGACNDQLPQAKKIIAELYPSEVRPFVFGIEHSLPYGLGFLLKTLGEMKRRDQFFEELQPLSRNNELFSEHNLVTHINKNGSRFLKYILAENGPDFLKNMLIRMDIQPNQIRMALDNQMIQEFDKLMREKSLNPHLQETFLEMIKTGLSNLEIENKRREIIAALETYNQQKFLQIVGPLIRDNEEPELLKKLTHMIGVWVVFYSEYAEENGKQIDVTDNLSDQVRRFLPLLMEDGMTVKERLEESLKMSWRNTQFAEISKEHLCQFLENDSLPNKIYFRIGAGHIEDFRQQLERKLPKEIFDIKIERIGN